MKKVAFGSDFHVDVAKKNGTATGDIIETVKQYLKENQVDVFCYAGDMGSNIKESIRILREIRDELGIIVRAVPGNHEMWDNQFASSFEVLQYFNEEGKDISVQVNPYEFDDWVVLGNMGWYDYSTAQPYYTEKQLDKMSHGGSRWNDRWFCRWEEKTNKEVSQLLINDLKVQLDKYKKKKIILMSHVVPYQDCIIQKGVSDWDYFNAFIGNTTIGKLADDYGVQIAQFGHTHNRFSKHSEAGVEMVCSPLGYYGEWTSEDRDVEEEIKKCIPIFEL